MHVQSVTQCSFWLYISMLFFDKLLVVFTITTWWHHIKINQSQSPVWMQQVTITLTPFNKDQNCSKFLFFPPNGAVHIYVTFINGTIITAVDGALSKPSSEMVTSYWFTVDKGRWWLACFLLSSAVLISEKHKPCSNRFIKGNRRRAHSETLHMKERQTTYA